MMGPMMDQSYIDPQMNNQPLSFNQNKGKPPMPIEGDRKKGDRLSSSSNMDNGMQMPLLPTPDGMGGMGHDGMGGMGGHDGMGGMGGHDGMGGMGGHDGMGGSSMMNQMMQGGGYFGGPMGGMGPMIGPMMSGGPNPDMMAMNNMMMFGSMGWDGSQMPMGGPPKEIIRMKSSVLYPPPPNAPVQTTRERPPGCRTIFVGGLPETATEEMLAEVFCEFGPTTSIRKSKKKNFAHVRFEDEGSVDRALFLSGYRMKVEDKEDKANTGRLHVDFAMARDDQYEFECKQRLLMRDMRHRQRMEEERLRPPSPPPITQYSDYEATSLTEKLKSDDDFMQASVVLSTWLERGDVNRRNINHFYSLIQCTNAHIRRLLGEKQGYEEELMRMKEKFKSIFEGILRQFDQIEKVFTLAQKQRNWDHFTKAQRKNIEMWLKQAKEIKQNQQEEFFSSRQEDEMDMSDDDDGPPVSKKKKNSTTPSTAEYSENLTSHYVEMAGKLNQLNTLRDENDSLKCQIEAYKNEVELSKHEQSGASGSKEKEMKIMQMAMQGMQQQLIQARTEVKELEKKTDEERAAILIQKEMLAEKQRILERDLAERAADKKLESSSSGEKPAEGEEKEEEADKTKSSVEESSTAAINATIKIAEDTISSTGLHITDKEAKLLGLVCCFLHVHPTGASIDYIWSYLHRLNVSCRVSELETLLEKLPVIFTQEVSGVGATIERRWHYTGYKKLDSP